MIEKYSFDIQLKKNKRKRLILVKADSESRKHVVLKLLSYIFYYDPRLQVEISVGMTYKPDLAIPSGSEQVPELWIDCGHVSLLKMRNLAKRLRNSRLILVKESPRELCQFKHLLERKMEGEIPEALIQKIEFLAFDKDFITQVAAALEKSNEVLMYEVMENVIGLALNEQVFESAVYRG